MKANELRIGNFYMYAGDTGIIYKKLNGIKINEFGFYSDLNDVNIEMCKPIPLTEEWLLKFGFVTPYHKDYFVLPLNDNDYIYYNPQGTGLTLNDGYGADNNFKIHLDSVHKLQNLYFALTNEELIIKTK